MTVTDAINQLISIQQNPNLPNIERWAEVYTFFQELTQQQCSEKLYVALMTKERKLIKFATEKFENLKIFLKNNIIDQINCDPLYDDEMMPIVKKINELFKNINKFEDLKKLENIYDDNFTFYYDKNEYFEFNDLDNDFKIEAFTIKLQNVKKE